MSTMVSPAAGLGTPFDLMVQDESAPGWGVRCESVAPVRMRQRHEASARVPVACGSMTPARTREQRFAALAVANDVRVRRAGLKRDLKAGRVNVLDVIAEPPEWALSMKVLDVLTAVPRFGLVKAGKLLKWAGVAPSKTLGGVTDRQRDALVKALVWRLR